MNNLGAKLQVECETMAANRINGKLEEDIPPCEALLEQ